MSKPEFSVIILAAGKGTRMKSPLPKVLHPVAGTPMIKKVIDAVKEAGAAEVRIVVGYGEALVRKVVEPLGASCFTQTNQWGTADAVKAADPKTLKGNVLILNGDHPLIQTIDIQSIMKQFEQSAADLAVVTAELKNPASFGRIVRHQGELRAIVEVTDASKDTLQIREVNTGIYIVTADTLVDNLPRIQNHNAKKEFYLTDLVSICQEAGDKVKAFPMRASVAFGVNTQDELARATQILFTRKRRALMEAGVLMIDPKTVYAEESVTVGSGSVLYPGVYLRGQTLIGSFCVIEPNCYIAHSRIEDSVHIKAGTYMEGAIIASKASVGPYAHLRVGTEIGVEAHIGNFVELKKTKFGARSKAGHLSYLGDAQIGEDVNIGCGTITCNYAVDRQKYRTKIGDRVFVGSDTQFVAPIEIGNDAIIGSGSTITKDVPAFALAVARGKQFIKKNYAPKKLEPVEVETSEGTDSPEEETSIGGSAANKAAADPDYN
jgi:bifunctional UDP-N-acetylglucosamine pyrophosphorylase/glucosamine-1-phosphate N-acetyltransferase